MFTRWFRSKNHPRPRSPYGNLIAHMQKKLEEKPADQRLRLSLVSHLEMAGRYEEAAQHARSVIRYNPENRRAKGMLLRLRLEQRLAAIHRTPI